MDIRVLSEPKGTGEKSRRWIHAEAEGTGLENRILMKDFSVMAVSLRHSGDRSCSLGRTENIYNKMSNILYKYLCQTTRVLQYSMKNTKNTSSKNTFECPLRDAQPHKDTIYLYPPK